MVLENRSEFDILNSIAYRESEFSNIPTVADRNVVHPSTTLLFAFTTVFPIPSPMNIKLVFFLSTSTFSKYAPAFMYITNLHNDSSTNYDGI